MLLEFFRELLQAHQVVQPLFWRQLKVFTQQSAINIFLVSFDHRIRLEFCGGLKHVHIIRLNRSAEQKDARAPINYGPRT